MLTQASHGRTPKEQEISITKAEIPTLSETELAHLNFLLLTELQFLRDPM